MIWRWPWCNDGGARGVMIIVIGNGHGDIAFHIALISLGKV